MPQCNDSKLGRSQTAPSATTSQPPWECSRQGHAPRLICLTEPPFASTVGGLAVTSKLPHITWEPKKHIRLRETVVEDGNYLNSQEELDARPIGQFWDLKVVCEHCGHEEILGWREPHQDVEDPAEESKAVFHSIPAHHRQTQLIPCVRRTRGDEKVLSLCGASKRYAISALASSLPLTVPHETTAIMSHQSSRTTAVGTSRSTTI